MEGTAAAKELPAASVRQADGAPAKQGKGLKGKQQGVQQPQQDSKTGARKKAASSKKKAAGEPPALPMLFQQEQQKAEGPGAPKRRAAGKQVQAGSKQGTNSKAAARQQPQHGGCWLVLRAEAS